MRRIDNVLSVVLSAEHGHILILTSELRSEQTDGYMADIRHELTICPECDGDGWYSDHDPSDPHIDGVCSNCPVQVQCEKCEATGLVYRADLEEERQQKELNNQFIDDMPF